MASYITVLIKYEEGQKQPAFNAGMEVLGGKIDTVQFSDAFAEIERLTVELEGG